MSKQIIYILVWEIAIFISVFALMFYALQAVDFSKIFKKNSTFQIKVIICFVSAAVGFAISMGIGEILKLILEIN